VDKLFVQKINSYISSLQDTEHFLYYPSNFGLTQSGKNLKLGFSCYALKCLYITKEWDNLTIEKKDQWIDYINSFQKNINGLPNNSFIDNEFINKHNSFNLLNKTKNFVKKSLSTLNLYTYESPRKVLENNIRAETKQAIATLYQVGKRNANIYEDFPKDKSSIYNFLDSFNWNRPWHAGAQFSGLCVFTETQLKGEQKAENKNLLEQYIMSKINVGNGFYYSGPLPNSSELINGSMKVLTGLDWLSIPIHKPEKLIDFCLLQKPLSEGCDLVDIVYVMYRCSLETNYKKIEIKNYFESLKKLIFSHFKEGESGFSYFTNKSQTSYYGINITSGENVADLHGTLLLLWALSMIYYFENNENELFNIIKP